MQGAEGPGSAGVNSKPADPRDAGPPERTDWRDQDMLNCANAALI